MRDLVAAGKFIEIADIGSSQMKCNTAVKGYILCKTRRCESFQLLTVTMTPSQKLLWPY